MPSPLVVLSATLLARLRGPLDEHAFAASFHAADLRTSTQPDGSIHVVFDTAIYAPALAPLFSRHRHGLTLCTEASVAALPPPMPDAVLDHLLDVAGDILCRAPALTGHERLDLLDAITVAKNGQAPTFPMSSEESLLPTALNETALTLARRLASAIAALEDRVAAYQAAIAGTYLEGTIALLGLQGEAANTFVIGQARAGDSAHDAILLQPPVRMRTDRCRTALQAPDALLRAAPEVTPLHYFGGRPAGWMTARECHTLMFRDILPANLVGKPRKTAMRIRPHRRTPTKPARPPAHLAMAMSEWSSTFLPERWSDFPWLVRIGLGHLAFEEIHPFSDGNGRIGRLMMVLQMIEQGLPALPLEAAIRQRHQAYLGTVGTVIASGDAAPFLRFLISALETAVEMGVALLHGLRPHYEALVAAIDASRYPVLHTPDVAGHWLGRLVLKQDDFISFDWVPVDPYVPQWEQAGVLRPIQIGEQRRWIVPGVPDLVRRVIRKPKT